MNFAITPPNASAPKLSTPEGVISKSLLSEQCCGALKVDFSIARSFLSLLVNLPQYILV